jgi:hypothetical protein
MRTTLGRFHRMISCLFLFSVVFTCLLGTCRGSHPSSLNNNEVLVQAPVIFFTAGPQSFRINTTALNASLVRLDTTMADYCLPLTEAESLHVQGKTVLLELRWAGCSTERAYLNLVNVGVKAILVYQQNAFFSPGHFYHTRGLDTNAVCKSGAQHVPMMHISEEQRQELEQQLEKHVLHLIIESSPNGFTTLYQSNAYFVLKRCLTPFAHFLVVVMSLYLARFRKNTCGSTHSWVIAIEMVPAMILCVYALLDVEVGDFLSREAALPFSWRFLLSQSTSTVLVCRYWRAQALACKTACESAPKDPQLSWTSRLITMTTLCLEVAFCSMLYSVSTGNEWFQFRTLLVLYNIVEVVNGIVCCIMFVEASFQMLKSTKSPSSTRRIIMYIAASMIFMIIMCIAVILVAGLRPLSPDRYFVLCCAIDFSRAATGLCLLLVFLPQPRSVHPSDVDIHVDGGGEVTGKIQLDTLLLAKESELVKAQRARIHELEREEKENEKVRQELETKETIARIEVRDLRLEKAQMLENENNRLKAERAADSSLNHTLKVRVLQRDKLLSTTPYLIPPFMTVCFVLALFRCTKNHIAAVKAVLELLCLAAAEGDAGCRLSSDFLEVCMFFL